MHSSEGHNRLQLGSGLHIHACRWSKRRLFNSKESWAFAALRVSHSQLETFEPAFQRQRNQAAPEPRQLSNYCVTGSQCSGRRSALVTCYLNCVNVMFDDDGRNFEHELIEELGSRQKNSSQYVVGALAPPCVTRITVDRSEEPIFQRYALNVQELIELMSFKMVLQFLPRFPSVAYINSVFTVVDSSRSRLQ